MQVEQPASVQTGEINLMIDLKMGQTATASATPSSMDTTIPERGGQPRISRTWSGVSVMPLGVQLSKLNLLDQSVVEPRGFEPLTSSMPLRRSTN